MGASEAVAMFQFQMVRLKVAKSSALTFVTKFQFQMVRLKEMDVEVMEAFPVRGFNSKWYD